MLYRKSKIKVKTIDIHKVSEKWKMAPEEKDIFQ